MQFFYCQTFLASPNDGESVEFPGLAIAHLAADANKLNKTGRILRTNQLAKEYGFVDVVRIIQSCLF